MFRRDFPPNVNYGGIIGIRKRLFTEKMGAAHFISYQYRDRKKQRIWCPLFINPVWPPDSTPRAPIKTSAANRATGNGKNFKIGEGRRIWVDK